MQTSSTSPSIGWLGWSLNWEKSHPVGEDWVLKEMQGILHFYSTWKQEEDEPKFCIFTAQEKSQKALMKDETLSLVPNTRKICFSLSLVSLFGWVSKLNAWMQTTSTSKYRLIWAEAQLTKLNVLSVERNARQSAFLQFLKTSRRWSEILHFYSTRKIANEPWRKKKPPGANPTKLFTTVIYKHS